MCRCCYLKRLIESNFYHFRLRCQFAFVFIFYGINAIGLNIFADIPHIYNFEINSLSLCVFLSSFFFYAAGRRFCCWRRENNRFGKSKRLFPTPNTRHSKQTHSECRVKPSEAIADFADNKFPPSSHEYNGCFV